MRLIDADLLKQCYTGKNSLGTNDNNSKADYASIRKMIDSQPTAFDVDKVVAQLESFKCSKEEAEKDMDKFIRNQHFDMCISIVKAGGWNKEKEAIE